MSIEPNASEGRTDAVSVRLFRPSVVVLCGPAASGKTTFAEHHFRATQVISSDWARARVCDDEKDQRFNAQAFDLVYFLIEQRLSLNRLCVVDSTALTTASRKELLDLAKRFHVPTMAMILDLPLELCMERDEKRVRSVGPEVVERQYQLFEAAKSAIQQEGFDQVRQFSQRELDNVRIEIVFRPLIRQPHNSEPGTPRRPERSAAASTPNAKGNGVPVSRAKQFQTNSAPPPTVPVAPAHTRDGGGESASTSQPTVAVSKPGPSSSPAPTTESPVK